MLQYIFTERWGYFIFLSSDPNSTALLQAADLWHCVRTLTQRRPHFLSSVSATRAFLHSRTVEENSPKKVQMLCVYTTHPECNK